MRIAPSMPSDAPGSDGSPFSLTPSLSQTKKTPSPSHPMKPGPQPRTRTLALSLAAASHRCSPIQIRRHLPVPSPPVCTLPPPTFAAHPPPPPHPRRLAAPAIFNIGGRLHHHQRTRQLLRSPRCSNEDACPRSRSGKIHRQARRGAPRLLYACRQIFNAQRRRLPPWSAQAPPRSASLRW